jgi:uncharacterized protein (UPF0276 family)
MAVDSNVGVGIGLRTAHFEDLLARPARVGWLEATSENFMMPGGRPLHVLERLRRDYPLVLHGVSLSIGGTDPLDRSYLARLCSLIERFAPLWVSDHLCWTGARGHNLHDLLPLPWNEETLDHVARRVEDVQTALGRPLVLENVSTYLTFSHSTMSEWEFLAALAARTGCQILLDVNNVYVSGFNHGFDAVEYLDAIPAERVVQIHLAGHTDLGTHLLDTHDHPVAEPVWGLYLHALRRLGAVPTLIEWDGNVPPLERLEEEADRARSVMDIACASRLGAPSGASHARRPHAA